MSCKEHLHFNVAKSHCLSDLIMRSIQVPEGVFKIILNKSKTAWEFWLRNAASCGWVTRAWHAESGNYAIKRIHGGLWTGAVTQGGLEENMWWWGRHQVAWLLLDSCFHNPLQISISRDLISNSVYSSVSAHPVLMSISGNEDFVTWHYTGSFRCVIQTSVENQISGVIIMTLWRICEPTKPRAVQLVPHVAHFNKVIRVPLSKHAMLCFIFNTPGM